VQTCQSKSDRRTKNSLAFRQGSVKLYGDCRKGRRPSFDRSAQPDRAEQLYDRFVLKLRESGLRVETGRFGAMMQVAIENDGPVTLLLDREVAELGKPEQ
jgi:D-tyrosyl-tRNA(Tyr) deacylase